MKRFRQFRGIAALLATGLLLMCADGALATMQVVTGPAFNLEARGGYISTPDGSSIYTWGYGQAGQMQYPGPNLAVTEGQTVIVNLTNMLTVPVSMVFPGQVGVTATMIAGTGNDGLLTMEANPGETVQYSFVAANPGTYLYHSGTRPELQIEMGLVGALIVRPALGPNYAYNDASTEFTPNCEYLFLLTEMDPVIHLLVEFGYEAFVDNTTYFPVYWFINGRCAPDTMRMNFDPWLPNQPYNCMPMMEPGDKMLMRLVGAGRDLHPFHHHGNHSQIIGRNGRFLEGRGETVFTIQTVPGQTVEAIFEWTGEGLGWDMYGHPQDIDNPPLGNFPGDEDIDHNGDGLFDNVPMEPNEYAPDHGKPFPVNLPEPTNLVFGGFWSGSPFLGQEEQLPPGEGGLNPCGVYTYMWHSHTEKEMVNNDIFPGGMMTMLMIMPPGGCM